MKYMREYFKFIVISIFFWIVNLFAAFDMLMAGEFNTLFIFRVIGIVFAPLGALLGLI